MMDCQMTMTNDNLNVQIGEKTLSPIAVYLNLIKSKVYNVYMLN